MFDTDGDSMGDGFEIENGLDPLEQYCPKWVCPSSFTSTLITGFHQSDDFDLDADGLTNIQEDSYGTSRTNSDSDGDGLTDGEEINRYKTNALVADSDGDSLSDGAEVLIYKSNPLLTDSDGDSMPDAEEIDEGLNPIDDSDCPSWYCSRFSPSLIEAATH